MNLSEHFTLSELTMSERAARDGLDNTPSSTSIENLKRLAAALEAIRVKLGRPIVVTSGYRAPLVNKAVGGAADSAHVLGLAADINCPGMTPKALALFIKSSGVKYDQLILEYDTWVHFGLSCGTLRGQDLTKRTGTPYMAGLL